MNIGKQIKERRLELNLTQEQVAEKIYVSVKSISNWENGKNFPDIESLIRLAKLYELSLDYLLLEGSDIVKDIKEKTELKSLEHGMNVTLLIGLTISALLSTKSVYTNDTIQWGLIIILYLNIINTFWFSSKLKKLRKNLAPPANQKDASSKFKLIMYYSLICIVVGVVFIIFLHNR